MSSHPFTWLDVFTDTPLQGNQLAVVHEADGVDDATMHAFARETNLSETTFVQSPGDPDADYRNRIWTVGFEMRFAGHPTLGTAVAVAHRRGESSARYVQQTIAGLQPVEVELDGDRASGSMLQEAAQLGAAYEAGEVLATLGLAASDGEPTLEPRLVSTGHGHLLVTVADPAALERVRPDGAAVAALLQRTGGATVYLAWVDPGHGVASARAFFTDGEMLRQDPATGSAAGPLMAYVHARTGAERLDVDQGVAMGRASRLRCRVEGDRVRVGGDCVIVAEGTVTL